MPLNFNVIKLLSLAATAAFFAVLWAPLLINFLYKDGADLDCGPTTGTITDIDGNVYQTIEVCNQW